MVQKACMVEELGEHSLLLPDRVGRALAANSRVKYYMSLLQAARLHADSGEETATLRAEREASHIDDPSLDSVVAASRPAGADAYFVPHAGDVHVRMLEDVAAMIAPLAEAPADGHAEAYRERLRRLEAACAAPVGDVLPRSYLHNVTRVDRKAGDSMHLLVMDLHRELHGLQEVMAQETIDGARVFGISDRDRPRVAAFMRGVNATAPLKFDHPGLSCTATRAESGLVIENDIGATDAHVVVIAVEGLEATVTYTDVHRRRAEFFQSLLDTHDVKWADAEYRRCAGLSDEQDYLLVLGRLRARDERQLREFLRHLGSRLVFLIDWNRARKRLRRFLPKRACLEVLRWAADRDCGHRGFLQLGGDQLVFDAVERAARGRVRYGQRLDRVLGEGTAVDVMKQILRITATGLREHRSTQFIRDEVEAELVGCMQEVPDSLLSLASRHAVLVFELATGVRDAWLRAPSPDGEAAVRRMARSAAGWERRADELVRAAASPTRRTAAEGAIARVLSAADDAADRLEETAFLLTLMPVVHRNADLYGPLADLAELAVDTAQEYVKALESAGGAVHGGGRDDMEDFLAAVEGVGTNETGADRAERRVLAVIFHNTYDGRKAHLGAAMASALEAATDAMLRGVLILRDHVLRGANGHRGGE